MSDVFRPEGSNDWKKPEAHTTARYAEYNSTGAGASPTHRPAWTKQLTKSEAQKITVEKVPGGADYWNPDLTYPYSAKPQEARRAAVQYRSTRISAGRVHEI